MAKRMKTQQGEGYRRQPPSATTEDAVLDLLEGINQTDGHRVGEGGIENILLRCGHCREVVLAEAVDSFGRHWPCGHIVVENAREVRRIGHAHREVMKSVF